MSMQAHAAVSARALASDICMPAAVVAPTALRNQF